MSGILGIVHGDGRPVDRDLLCRMTRSLAARGPDAQDVWIDGPIGLGHTLLRTTDDQPMEKQPLTIDGTTWIVADARIDRRDELRTDLVARGHEPPAGAVDAELILRAYHAWGERCVEHLFGDFGFAIWDKTRHALFGARDHFGIRPFMYAHVGDALVFSNTLNCLRLHPDVGDALDEQAIADFLLFGNPLDADRSSFADIRRLPPAHTLRWSRADGLTIRRYWDLPFEPELHLPRRRDYIDQFRALFDRAVRDRLRTRCAAVFMSGGLDSPAVAATAHRILCESSSPFDLQAHTILLDRLVRDDERRFSTSAARFIGIPVRHESFDHYGFPPPEPEPDWYPPEPRGLFDGGRAIAIRREAAAQARVHLWGLGADMLIYGTDRGLQDLLRRRRYGRIVADFAWLLGTRRQVPKIGIRTVLRRAIGQPPTPPIQPYPTWLAQDYARRHQLFDRWRTMNSIDYLRPGFELRGGFWPLLFEAADPGEMNLPAESRYPFMDVPLAEFLLRLPELPWRQQKNLLRIAMADRLPPTIVRRPKAPLSGDVLRRMLPDPSTRWWDRYVRDAPELARFVDIDRAGAALEDGLGRSRGASTREEHDRLGVTLRAVGLAVWLHHQSRAKVSFARP